MPTALPPKRRSELRAEAHQLTPVVIIGDKGLSDEVIAEIDRSLKAHELIKVRAATDDRKARDGWLATICARLEAQAVQQIGKVFVVYRENPKDEPPKRRPRAAAAEPEPVARRRAPRQFKRKPGADFKGKPDTSDVKGTSRPRSRAPSPRPESEPPRRRPRSSR